MLGQAVRLAVPERVGGLDRAQILARVGERNAVDRPDLVQAGRDPGSRLRARLEGDRPSRAGVADDARGRLPDARRRRSDPPASGGNPANWTIGVRLTDGAGSAAPSGRIMDAYPSPGPFTTSADGR